MKKRGFGTGLWNGTGGKVEPGETVLEAATRECIEEIGVRPLHLMSVGRLAFYIEDKPEFAHDITIFTAEKWEGEPHETDEMRPQWFSTLKIPYDTMWADDKLWLPLVLNGHSVSGEVTMNTSGTIINAKITPGIVQL